MIGAIMDGELTPAQSGGLLVALASRGETVDEIAGAARAMRERSLHVEHGLPEVVDVVGTGGDSREHDQCLDDGGARRGGGRCTGCPNAEIGGFNSLRQRGCARGNGYGDRSRPTGRTCCAKPTSRSCTRHAITPR